jgi:hypothetical protein
MQLVQHCRLPAACALTLLLLSCCCVLSLQVVDIGGGFVNNIALDVAFPDWHTLFTKGQDTLRKLAPEKMQMAATLIGNREGNR